MWPYKEMGVELSGRSFGRGGGDTEQICLIDKRNGWGFDKAGVQREDKGQPEKNNGDRKVEKSGEGE